MPERRLRDLRNMTLYWLCVKSRWRSGRLSTRSSSRIRSSPCFRKLEKSGRFVATLVSLKAAARSPLVCSRLSGLGRVW